MALSASRPTAAPQPFGRLCWLPPNGEGNGIHELNLRPPLSGNLRAMPGQRGERYAPYLANLWRPASQPRGERSPEAAGLDGRKPAAGTGAPEVTLGLKEATRLLWGRR
jgi:hypothetical protein